MALAPFFDRVYGALGGHLAISREALATALNGVTVGVRCGQNLRSNDLWVAELSINLLARLYPRLAISGPKKLCTMLSKLGRDINPNLEIVSNAPGATTLCIGSANADDGIYPSASGWVVRVNHTGLQTGMGRTGPANPYAAGAAAALGCAEVFRRTFCGVREPEKDVSVSLLRFDNGTGANMRLACNNIGDVLFAGVGAVGNAALWALARDPAVRGHIRLVDAEEVTLSNLQRYVLAAHKDIGRSKVLLGKESVAETRLIVAPHKLTLEQFSGAHDVAPIPSIVVSVDNVEGRRSAQALLPRLVVNGWTGEQALGASWHVFSHDVACLACLYHPHGQGLSQIAQAAKALGLGDDRAAQLWVTRQPLTDPDIAAAATALGIQESDLAQWRGKSLGDLYTDVVCGAVPLDVGGIGRIETIPLAHQSALAGILMATELVKRTHRKLGKLSQPEPLVSWDDILREPPAIWRKPRARESGCICGDPDYQDIYARKWGTAINAVDNPGRGHHD